ncbi:DnaT-like ssDNA-binding domain-containing protein [Marinomonas epiphytica]
MFDNDYSVPVSFSLAAKIGLEEAVLLTFLKQQVYLINSPVLTFEASQLSSKLPFWTMPQLLRLLENLQLSQLIQYARQEQVLKIEFPMQGTAVKSGTGQKDSYDDALMNKMKRLHKESQKSAPRQPEAPVSSKPAYRQAPNEFPASVNNAKDRRGVTDFDLYLEQKERSRQPDQWQPEEATLEQISQAGINREFAIGLQTEFLLRIKEQRKNVRTWNSEFFKYVKRQWQYKQADRTSYEGTSVSSKFGKTSREQVSDALSNIHDTDW